MDEPVYHIPALLSASLEALDIKPDGVYIDATYGGGGHSSALVERLSPQGHLFGFDRDIEAVERAMKDSRFTMIHGNFSYLTNFMRFHGILPGSVDGILADLGVSFHHFDDPARGFSFRFEGPLDMRMNQRGGITAAQYLASADESEIADTLYIYGEMKNARKIARAIVAERGREPVDTVERLLEVIKPFINPKQEKKELAQVFQALRIKVNGEMQALESLLTQSLKMLGKGGRLAIITYHSLEDRMVKNFMKTGNIAGNESKDFFGRNLAPMRLLTSKPIVPSAEEVEANPRSRSAKLRVATKL